jgi:formylglycine-generating enzyme required for sulfatase activity
MPPRYLRKASPTRLKPCAEFTVETCDTAPADQCCGALPCKLCLEWETYEDGISYGSATFAGTSWTGTVGGHSFVSYWEREILPDITPPVSSNSIGMPFALIKAGIYTMGSPGSETGRDADETEVSTSVNEFVIGTTEVTQSQYLTVRGLSPSHFSGSGRPVEKVSYADAQAFCTALSALPAEIAMGRSYRLPTEAEWEFACRAGTTTAYNFGANAADLLDNGWFVTNSGAETHDVGGKPANAKGLVDAHGNVWEWVENSRLDGSAGDQVIRGGGWNSTAAECRSASRTLIAETTKRNDIGFRVVMVRSPIPQFGECEYIVTLDDEEVYRATCYEGASCRDPAGDVAVSTAYLEGTLRWSKHEPRELALIVDPNTGCRDFFCGNCRCSCECLCVTITEFDGTVIAGEICDTSYPCDAPVWAGTVGYYDLSIALGRDEYTGECIITLTADGQEQDSVFVTGCSDMSASVTLYDGTVVSVTCKQCSCDQSVDGCPCCPGWPLERSANIYFASIEQSVNDCVPIIALQEYSDIFGCSGTALNYNIFQNVGNFLFVRVVCNPDTLAWVVEYKSLATGMVANDPDTGSWVEVVFDFVCPDCADSIDGVAYGSFDFIAVHACETSGGLVSFNVLVHADVEVQCV